jgi:hypothetical protein
MAGSFFCGEGPRFRCYGRTAALRLIVQPCDEDDSFFFFRFSCNGAPMEWNSQNKNRSTRRETCPSATLSTANPIWTDLGSNPGPRGGRPATNRLQRGTAVARQLLKRHNIRLLCSRHTLPPNMRTARVREVYYLTTLSVAVCVQRR